MKRIVSLVLACVLTLTLALCATACATEKVTGFTTLRDHVTDTVGDEVVQLDVSGTALKGLILGVIPMEGEGEQVALAGHAVMSNLVLQCTLQMEYGTDEYKVNYEVFKSTGELTAYGLAEIDGSSYTGDETISFYSVNNITPQVDITHRENATALLNSMLPVLDKYLAELDMDLNDLGFTALADRFRAPVEAAEEEEDLGGPLSVARLTFAGQMTLMGMGTIFAVLAILWLVLLIFKAVHDKNEKAAAAKAPEAAETPAPAEEPAPAAVEDDGAIIAAITAAVAATIASDPALTEQFAGGFRVVSYKKKSGKNAWNR